MKYFYLSILFLLSFNTYANREYRQGFKDGFQQGLLSCGGNTSNKSVMCIERDNKHFLIRSADGETLGTQPFINKNDCLEAEVTSFDRYACVQDHYFSYVIYLYDVIQNKRVASGQFGETCFNSLKRIKRGGQLICTYGQGWDSLQIYNVDQNKKLFTDRSAGYLKPNLCIKIIDNVKNNSICYPDTGVIRNWTKWHQFDIRDGRKVNETSFNSFEECLKN